MLYMHTTYTCGVIGLLCFLIMARYPGKLSGDGDECRDGHKRAGSLHRGKEAIFKSVGSGAIQHWGIHR